MGLSCRRVDDAARTHENRMKAEQVAELYFDSLESIQAAMASGGGQATVAHAMEISTGGPPVVLIAEHDKPL